MKRRKDPNIYPPGLNAKKVADIIAYYDSVQDVPLEELADHAPVKEPTSWMEVPLDLVPQVRKLIAKHRKSA